MKTQIVTTRHLLTVVLVLSILTGCSNRGDQVAPPNQSTPPPPTTGVVQITDLVVVPAVVRPGQNVTLTVTANTSGSGALTYLWHAVDGSLSSRSNSSTAWTAPLNESTYHLSVDVSDGDGSARAYASVVVATGSANSAIISSVLPGEAHALDVVRITGQGFGSTQGSSALTVDAISATTISAWSDTAIDFQVPAGAVTGNVVVTVGGIDSNPAHLVVPWANSNPTNVAITRAANSQLAAQLVSDGAGGAIVVWVDYRTGNADIYAQRVDRSGATLWATDGVAIATTTDNQLSPQLVSDGNGGAIIVWEDYRAGNADIYSQQIDANGIAQWSVDGVAVSAATGNQISPRLVSDGSSGAIIVWEDHRAGNADIYAQRVDSSGAMMWTADGIVLADEAHNQFLPTLVSDMSNGAIVAWEDYRNNTDYDIYLQRIDGNGTPQWIANGIAAVATTGNQLATTITTDGTGGAILAWEDYRSADSNIFAQRVNGDGTMAWTANGVSVVNATGNQISPRIIATGDSSNSILTWEDYRSGNAEVFAQYLNSSGVTQWTLNGITFSQATSIKRAPHLVADGTGGAILAWENNESGNSDIYAQRLTSTGTSLWGGSGVSISSTTASQVLPELAEDGENGAVIIWRDYRNGNADLYAQGITAAGSQ